MMSCVFDPGLCFSQGIDWLAAIFPLGLFGIGLLVGALIGKFGVSVLFGAMLLMRGRKEEPEMYRHPDDPQPPKKRRSF